MKTRVFISYSRKDLAFVDRLVAALEDNGIAPSIDRTEIYSFEDWWKRLRALIDEADAVVFVLSPDAVGSGVCRREVDYALSLNKRFAPIVCRPIGAAVTNLPRTLADLNFIFFDEPNDFATSIAKLVDALHTDIAWVRRHTAFGLEAEAWNAAGRPTGLLLRSPRLEEAEQWLSRRPDGAPLPTDTLREFIAAGRSSAARRRRLLRIGAGLAMFAVASVALLLVYERSEDSRRRLGLEMAEALERSNEGDRFRDVDMAMAASQYESALNIRKKLAAEYPDDGEIVRGLAVAYTKMGKMKLLQNQIAQSMGFYDEGVSVFRKLNSFDSDDQSRIDLVLSLDGDAYAALFNHLFEKARDLCEEAIALNKDYKITYVYLAHSLMFLGRTKEARTIYLDHRGSSMGDNVPWDVWVEDDFTAFRKQNLTSPLMPGIEAAFGRHPRAASKARR